VALNIISKQQNCVECLVTLEKHLTQATVIIEPQIIIFKLFLVTLKTGGMMQKIQLFSQEYISVYNIL